MADWRNLDPPGRFLTKATANSHHCYYDVGDEAARKRTAKSLSERIKMPWMKGGRSQATNTDADGDRERSPFASTTPQDLRENNLCASLIAIPLVSMGHSNSGSKKNPKKIMKKRAAAALPPKTTNVAPSSPLPTWPNVSFQGCVPDDLPSEPQDKTSKVRRVNNSLGFGHQDYQDEFIRVLDQHPGPMASPPTSQLDSMAYKGVQKLEHHLNSSPPYKKPVPSSYQHHDVRQLQQEDQDILTFFHANEPKALPVDDLSISWAFEVQQPQTDSLSHPMLSGQWQDEQNDLPTAADLLQAGIFF